MSTEDSGPLSDSPTGEPAAFIYEVKLYPDDEEWHETIDTAHPVKTLGDSLIHEWRAVTPLYAREGDSDESGSTFDATAELAVEPKGLDEVEDRLDRLQKKARRLERSLERLNPRPEHTAEVQDGDSA